MFDFSNPFRQHLVQAISPLRRRVPKVPFYRLAAHRIPTLWSLYRCLLRESPTNEIYRRVQDLFRLHKGANSARIAKRHLETGYKWLDVFKAANAGEHESQDILLRYTRMLAVRYEKKHWRELIENEMAWQHRLRSRPIMTGGYLRASYSNKPLPRLKPQPLAITRMIFKRRRARHHRAVRANVLSNIYEDLKVERDFEMGLAKLHHFEPSVYAGKAWGDWLESINQERQLITEAYERDQQRASTPFDPKMLEQIKQARREKIANKTRELERERRGEVLRRTILRRNQGPPASVLRLMTPKQRAMDRVVRNVSEVGYVAQVKMQLGFKLRNPEKWKEESGPADRQGELDRLEEQVRQENVRRREQDARTATV